MKHTIFAALGSILIPCLIPLTLLAQDPTSSPQLDSVATHEQSEALFKVVEQMPRFPGCENQAFVNTEKERCAQQKMLEYVYKNLKYPENAKNAGVQGRAVVQFIVERDGSITNVQCIRDIGYGCGEESVRVIESMNQLPEKWTPGLQRGVPVRVQFVFPVSFKL